MYIRIWNRQTQISIVNMIIVNIWVVYGQWVVVMVQCQIIIKMMDEANIDNQQHSPYARAAAFRFGSIKRNHKQAQPHKPPSTHIITPIKTNIDINSQHIQIIASPTSSHSPPKQTIQTKVSSLPIQTRVSNLQNAHYGYNALHDRQAVRNGDGGEEEEEEDVEREINRHFNNQEDEREEEFMEGEEIEFGFRENGSNNKNGYETDGYRDGREQGVHWQNSNKYDKQNINQDRQNVTKDKQNINHYLLSQNAQKHELKNNFMDSHSSQRSPKLTKKPLLNPKTSSIPSSHHQSQHLQPMPSHRTTYGPGGIQTLQFNPQKQKLIILDSKQTQNPPFLNSFPISQFCQPIQLPKLTQLPAPEHSPDKLVQIAKDMFSKFGCVVNDQTVINVRKYKNCVLFSISIEENLLFQFQCGKLYFGGWKTGAGEGEKYGQGLEIVPGKYKFKGFFLDGKKSGAGTMINWDGSAYVGQWENGLKSGAGRQLDSDGIIYEGQWKEGKKSGYGKIYNNGKLQFEGVFQKGLKNGYGKQYFQNGDFYDGNYLNHKFEGKGTYCWITGATYTGDFKEGKRNGYGIWKSSGNNYDIYQGEYVNDKKHGKGIYRWSNGAVYQGYFKDDLKNGQGSIIYQNGKVAHLTWKNGKAEKKLQKLNKQQEQQVSSYRHQLSQRKLPSRGTAASQSNQHQTQTQSRNKNTFIIGNRPTSRSTQNLQSAHSTSTHNSQRNSFKGITFNTRPANKLLSKVAESKVQPKIDARPQKDQVIRLRFDNKQFEKALGKNWDRNYEQSGRDGKGKGNAEVEKKPELPRDRPYQGIQASSNINMDL